MHHDVRVPMMLPDPNSNDLRKYSNPLRTAYHRCEVTVSTTAPAGTRAPNHHHHQLQPCPYHSCCNPLAERRLCTAALEVARRGGGDMYDVEPEECERFVLEHRHHRHERLGVAIPISRGQKPQHIVTVEDKLLQSPPMSSSSTLSLSSVSSSSSYDPKVDYNRTFPSQHLDKSPGHQDHPAEQQGEHGGEERGITVTSMMTTTWRDDLDELQWRDDHGKVSGGGSGGLAPIAGGVFAHQGRYRGPWEEQLFRAAERLYLLVSDAEMHYAVLRDLSVGGATKAVPATRDIFSPSSFPSKESVPASEPTHIRCCWEPIARTSSAAVAAAVNYVRVRETLQAQKFLVECMIQWAGERCLQCW